MSSSSSQRIKRPLSDERIYDSDDEDNHKRLKQEHEATKSEALVTEAGEPYWLLGNKKRVTVRRWKGKPLVDIREFYGDSASDDHDGTEAGLKPGKKGISLSLEQWHRLRELVAKIDAHLKRQ